MNTNPPENEIASDESDASLVNSSDAESETDVVSPESYVFAKISAMQQRRINGEDESYDVTPHRILEAMLFVGSHENEPLMPADAAEPMRGIKADEIAGMVSELNEQYQLEDTPYEIVSQNGGFLMVLKQSYQFVLNRFYGQVKDANLSQTAVDVLAVVAYKQPITRDEVDAIRGKPSSGLLSQLVRRQLLRIERTTDKPRKTYYHTTDRFLKLFELTSIKDLPSTDSGEYAD